MGFRRKGNCFLTPQVILPFYFSFEDMTISHEPSFKSLFLNKNFLQKLNINFLLSVRSGKEQIWIFAAHHRLCRKGESLWTRTLVLWALAIFLFLKNHQLYNTFIIIELVILFKSHRRFSRTPFTFGLILLYGWKT